MEVSSTYSNTTDLVSQFGRDVKKLATFDSTILPDFLVSGVLLNTFNTGIKKIKKKDITTQKKLYFKRLTIFKWYPYLMLVGIIVMSIHWALPFKSKVFYNPEVFPDIKWTSNNSIKYPFFCLILALLPFWRTKTFQPLIHAFSAGALIVTVVQMEIIFERTQCMVTYMMFMVMYRIIENRTLFDNIAICVAYTSDIASINHRAQLWYNSSNLFVWTFLAVACLLAHMYKRICLRIWEHVRVLIILREKTRLEKALGNFVIAAHIPQDIQNHLFKPVGCDSSAVGGVAAAAASPPQSVKSPLSSQSSLPPLASSALAMAAVQSSLAPLTGMHAVSSATSLNSASSVIKLRKAYTGKAFLKPALLSAAARPTSTGPQQQQPTGVQIRSIFGNISDSIKVSPKIPTDGGGSVKLSSQKKASENGSVKFGSRKALGDTRRNPSISGLSVNTTTSPTGSAAVQTSLGVTPSPSHYGILQRNKRVDDDVLRSASKAGIVSKFSDAQLSTAQLDSICGLDKRNTVLIAIKPDYSATRRECVLNNIQEYDFLELVDHLAVAHRVTRARVFGNTWVGCIGVFQSWDSDAANVYHGVMFACEVSIVARQFAGRVSLALDYGNVICGYLSNSLNFDFFGQEIRWLLMVVELREHGVVALGDSARTQLSVFKKHLAEVTKQQQQQAGQSSAVVSSMSQLSTHSLVGLYPDLPNVRSVDLDQRSLDQPWKTDSKITVNFIVNAAAIVDDESLQSRLTAFYNPVVAPSSPKWGVLSGRESKTDNGPMYVPPQGDERQKTLNAIMALSNDNANGRQAPRPAVDWFTFQRLLDDDEDLGRNKSNEGAAEQFDGDIPRGKKQTSNVRQNSTGKSAAQNKAVSAASIVIPREYRNIEARLDANGRLSKTHWNLFGDKDFAADTGSNREYFNMTPIDLHANQLGIEFQTSVYERYGLHLDDSVLDGMSAEELERAHAEVEGEVYKIVAAECFPTLFSLLLMTSVYKNIAGSQEYPSVMREAAKVAPLVVADDDNPPPTTPSSPMKRSERPSTSPSAEDVGFVPSSLSTDDLYMSPLESLFETNWLSYRFFTFASPVFLWNSYMGIEDHSINGSDYVSPRGRQSSIASEAEPSVHDDGEEVEQDGDVETNRHYRRFVVKPIVVTEPVSAWTRATQLADRVWTSAQRSVASGTKYAHLARKPVRMNRHSRVHNSQLMELSSHSGDSEPGNYGEGDDQYVYPERQISLLNQAPPFVVQQKPSGRTSRCGSDFDRVVISMRTAVLETVGVIREQSALLLGLANVYDDENNKSFKRSWFKYSSDSRQFLHNNYFNVFVDVVLTLVTWYALRPAYTAHTPHRLFSLLVDCSFLHLLIPAVVERRYEAQTFIVLCLLRLLFFYSLPSPVLCTAVAITTQNARTGFGDLGGDTLILLLTAFRISSNMRQSGWLTVIDTAVIRILVVRFWRGTVCQVTSTARLMSVVFNAQLFVMYHVIGHRTFIAYIIEHKLVPFAYDSHQRQKRNTRALLKAFVPEVPTQCHADMYVQKAYRHCAVTVLHVKAPDLLSGFIEAKELGVIMTQINDIVDLTIAQCGMLKVTQFSGVIVAVACKDSSWDRIEGLRSANSYTTRAIVLMRRIQKQMEIFSKDFNFNVSIGVAVNHGSASIGFLGHSRHCYDMSGATRDMCVAMASCNGDGIFASDLFEEDVRKSSPLTDDAGRREMSVALAAGGASSKANIVARSHGTHRSNGSYWLRIDGALSGMQLEDFEYVGMLGRGGYGSVHLMQERHTLAEYAIKAVVLKAGSVMSKMIARECIILQMMQHPNVVNLKYAFMNGNRMYLVMTYIQGGNLKQVLERDKLELKHITLWFAEIVLALEYVHNIGIIHRDVKPANCMIGIDGHLRLADFGLSKVVSSPGNVSSTFSSSGSVGSKEGASPQQRKHEEVESPVADSLGLTNEAYRKIQKFLPLKLTLAKSIVHPKHKLLRIVSVRPTIKYSQSMKFDSLTVEMIVAQSEEHALRIIHNKKNYIDAIFIDIDPRNSDIPGAWHPEQDGIAQLKLFCADCFNSLPVCVTTATLEVSKIRQSFLDAGAKDVFSVALANCDERTFRRLFSITDYSVGDSKASDDASSSSMQSAALTVSHSMDNHRPDTQHSSSGKLNRNDPSKAPSLHSAVGTLHFIAPEVLGMSVYGKPVDWWALGITIYECVVGEHLFKGEDKQEVTNQIMLGAIDLKRLRPFGEHVHSLVGGLLTKDVKTRLGTDGPEKIKMHPFFAHINWETVSETPPEYKPALFVNKKFDVQDRVLFYGETEKTDGKIFVSSGDHRDGSGLGNHSRFSSRRSHNMNNSSRSRGHKRNSNSTLTPNKFNGTGRLRRSSQNNRAGLSGSMNMSTEILLEEDEEEDEGDEDALRDRPRQHVMGIAEVDPTHSESASRKSDASLDSATRRQLRPKTPKSQPHSGTEEKEGETKGDEQVAQSRVIGQSG